MSALAITIVGGGPVGATLALALLARDIPCTVLEARPPGAADHDRRALALSGATRTILQRLALWQPLLPEITPIRTIHVSQRGSFGRTLLRAEEHGLDALGYVVSYGALSRVLAQALARCPAADVRYEAEVQAVVPGSTATRILLRHDGRQSQIDSALAVLADGGRSLSDVPGLQRVTREYGHDALVTRVSAELGHENIAYERFTPDGPVALLPNGVREFSLVWTGRREDVARLLALDDAAFLAALHAHFGDRVGRFLTVGRRLTFPLKLSRLKSVTHSHLVVVGNAAQTMHPVAGQGFNVGLRDAWELSERLAASDPAEWGSPAMLRGYAAGRQRDTRSGLLFTDFLVNVFSNDLVGVSELRSAGLGLLQALAPARRLLVRKMSFGARG